MSHQNNLTSLHPLLNQVLDRLGLKNIVEAQKSFSPEELHAFLQSTSEVLRESDLDRELLEQSLRLSSDEMEENHKKLVQASKMASLGEMAGGIAHEINNPLQILMGHAHRLLSLVDDAPQPLSEQIKKGAGAIEQNAKRIANIVKSLKTFSRNGTQDQKILQKVSEIVKETVDLCQESIKSSNIKLLLPPEIPGLAVPTRPAQISQVLLNLLTNARDAINSTKASAQNREHWIKLDITVDEKYLRFQVQDSGPGVPVDLEEKIMQPFFTTKGVNEGTGLGLSISNSIAKEHGGDLILDRSVSPSCFVLTIELEDPHLRLAA